MENQSARSNNAPARIFTRRPHEYSSAERNLQRCPLARNCTARTLGATYGQSAAAAAAAPRDVFLRVSNAGVMIVRRGDDVSPRRTEMKYKRGCCGRDRHDKKRHHSTAAAAATTIADLSGRRPCCINFPPWRSIYHVAIFAAQIDTPSLSDFH